VLPNRNGLNGVQGREREEWRMRLDDQRESDNIDDERGATGGGGGGGSGMGRGTGIRVGGIGAVLLVLGAIYFGVDPRLVLGLLGGGQGTGMPNQTQQQAAPPSAVPPSTQSSSNAPPTHVAAEDPQRRFVAKILGSTEDVWRAQFVSAGKTYHPPHLVLFTGGVQSGCGFAQTAMGPFYCPEDHKVYLDTAFFREMQDKLGASGDFARAYVIAHEVGHHVQNELGLMDMVASQRRGLDERGRNALSVKVELQADCFAGVWAKRADEATHILEAGDIEEGLNAAAAVGDDRLQRQARGTVTPDSFTHGTSAQRSHWFHTGLDSGAVAQCNTFANGAL
jgi:uncharacterized protein